MIDNLLFEFNIVNKFELTLNTYLILASSETSLSLRILLKLLVKFLELTSMEHDTILIGTIKEDGTHMRLSVLACCQVHHRILHPVDQFKNLFFCHSSF